MKDDQCDLLDAFDAKPKAPPTTAPPATTSAADDYVGEWQVLIDRAGNPRSLLQCWRDERDLRDELEVPVRERLALYEQICPEDLCREPMK